METATIKLATTLLDAFMVGVGVVSRWKAAENPQAVSFMLEQVEDLRRKILIGEITTEEAIIMADQIMAETRKAKDEAFRILDETARAR